MKTKYFIFAAAAALFAACSSDDGLVEQQIPQTVDDGAIQFSAYLNRGTTRAGYAGEITNTELPATGFGVFGYYTNNELYSESSKPNFFYNQKVSGADWTYSPVKYWPNEYGSAAISDAQDKLTFFAYAPWVDVEPTTGLLKTQSVTEDGKTTYFNNSGIVALTRNTASGDPFVKYFVDMEPAKRVDLCWGVAAENFTSSVEGTLNNITAGKTFKDVSKPTVNSKIKFNFKHALASLNVQIDADIDEVEHGTNGLNSRETKIFVRSVTFEGFASKGMFNLNAEASAPKWYDLTGINELTNGKVTIYDGRRDGSEGQVNAEASNETPKDLNPEIIQKYAENALSATAGVPSSEDPVNLFKSDNPTEPIYVIPTGEPLKVTIVYDVETIDDNLAAYLSDGKNKGSSIENTITKSITISKTNIGHTVGESLKLEAGYNYVVKLHLGMTSVKFDAEVTEWENADEGEPWLPINSGTSVALHGTLSETISASSTAYSFNITGLGNNAVLSTINGDGNYVSSTVTYPNNGTNTGTEGTATVNVKLNENTTVNEKKSTITVTYSGETKAIITQKPHELGLSLSWNGNTLIKPQSTATDVTFSDATIKIKKTPKTGDPVDLTQVLSSGALGDNKFFVGTSAIQLGTNAESGDVYTVSVKAGDAAEETVDIKYE